MHGKNEVQEFVATTLAAYPDFAMKLTFGFGKGHCFASEWVMTGTHTGNMTGAPATGRSFSVRGASITEFQDGKMKRHTDYLEPVAAARATPPAGKRPVGGPTGWPTGTLTP